MTSRAVARTSSPTSPIGRKSSDVTPVVADYKIATCDICGSRASPVFEVHGHWIRECGCGHRFAELARNASHVERVYGDTYFNGGGDGYPNYLDEAELITNQGRYYGQLLTKYTEPGRLLDVGAAAGFILRGLSEYRWRGIGLEPNGKMAAHARSCGFDVKGGSLEDFDHQGKFDLINMTQVIAHFHDLKRALGVASRLTESRGYWLIETWNKDSWLARLQGRHWHEYCPPSSLHYFSLDTLTALLDQFGFECVAHGRPPKRISLRHAASLFVHKLGSRKTPALPAWTIPYPSFDLMWALFRLRR